MSENSFDQQNENTMQSQEKKCCSNKIWAAISIISLLGVIALFIMTFACKKSCNTPAGGADKPAKTASVTASKPLTIAYINTDTIIKNYQYAKDLEAELKATQKNMEKSFQAKAAALQADFQNYLKTGSSLTLSEQKKKEESFGIREKEMSKLQESMMVEIQQKQMAENTKLINAIYAFIKDYNQKNQQYTVILKKSFLESPVLYIDEDLDLTTEILDGLNKEYAEVKGAKK